MNTLPSPAQMAVALGTALDRGITFSWLRGAPACGVVARDVQAGVYIRYNQDTFQQYVMPGLAAKLQTT